MGKRYILYILLLISLSVFSQSDKEREHVRRYRYQRIHAHHIGVGIETNMYENFRLSPRVFYSFGSYRNLFSVDGGIKYMYAHPMVHITKEKVAGHYLSPYASAKIHFWRWETGCLYAGGEFAYNIAVVGDHYLPKYRLPVRDTHIGSHHASVRAQVGLKMDRWELNVHYEYDLSPSWNQKYLFESAEYDYYILRPSLFERYRIGITFAYLFIFKQ